MDSEKALKNKLSDLRKKGDYQQAGELLKRGLDQYNNSRSLRMEGYLLFAANNQWEKAEAIALDLIEIEPDDPGHYMKLGRCYVHRKVTDKAEEAYQIAIEKTLGQSMEGLISDLQERIREDESITGKIESRYGLSGGKNNLGMILHDTGEQKYMTKVLEKKRSREAHFYQKILPKYPFLKEIVPRSVHVAEKHGILWTTTDFVDGRKPRETELDDALKMIYQTTSRIENREGLIGELKLPKYSLTLRDGKSQGLSKFFMRIHEKEVNERLFDLMEKKLKRDGRSSRLRKEIRHLRSLILEKEFYQRMNPEAHYGFIHGDLGLHNLLISNHEGRVYVLDWNSYKTGPKWYDVCNALAKTDQSFKEILSKVGQEKGEILQLDDLQRFFFIYAMTMIRIQGRKPGQFRRKDEKDLLAGIREMKELLREEGENSSEKTKIKKGPYRLPNVIVLSLLRSPKTPGDVIRRSYAHYYLRKARRLRSRAGIFMSFLLSPLRIIKEIRKTHGELGELHDREMEKGRLRRAFEMFVLSFLYGIEGKNYYLQRLYLPGGIRRGRQFFDEKTLKHSVYKMLHEYGKQLEFKGETGTSLGNKKIFYQRCMEKGLKVVPIYREIQADGAIHSFNDSDGKRTALPRENLFIKPAVDKEGRGGEVWYWKEGLYQNPAGETLTEKELTERLVRRAKTESSVKGKSLHGEELLVQPLTLPHKELGPFRIQATPTVRIITCLDKHRRVQPGLGMLRFSMKENAVVDNASAGGLVTMIDLESGTLGSTFSSELKGSNEPLDFPLKDGKGIKDRTLPYWEDCILLVKEAHRHYPERMIVGWDLIITDDGPLLLEGNAQPGICFIQRVHQQSMGDLPIGKAMADHCKKAVKALYQGDLKEMPGGKTHLNLYNGSRMKRWYSLLLHRKTVILGYEIFGAVQGVGYRNWLKKRAEVKNIHGWCRNSDQGTVSGVFYGKATDVEDLYRECFEGPDRAKVEKINVWKDHMPEPEGFRILRE